MKIPAPLSVCSYRGRKSCHLSSAIPLSDYKLPISHLCTQFCLWRWNLCATYVCFVYRLAPSHFAAKLILATQNWKSGNRKFNRYSACIQSPIQSSGSSSTRVPEQIGLIMFVCLFGLITKIC